MNKEEYITLEAITRLVKTLQNEINVREERIKISVNEEEVQNIIDCYEKDIKYIKQLEQENEGLKEQLKKADSITQSCIFEGKEESTINFRECLNTLALYKEVIEEVKTEISSLMSKYFYEKDFCIEDIHLDKLLQILDKVKGGLND